MADVNEEIVAQYLKLVKRWLYAVDITFAVDRGHSNIDLLAYDSDNDCYYDIEVKYRSAFSLTAYTKSGKDVSEKSVEDLVGQFTWYPERDHALTSFTGGKKPRKLLITTKTMMGVRKEKRSHLETAFKKGLARTGYPHAEIWYFDDIIPALVQHVSDSGKYNTELLQAIRMLKVYSNLDSSA
ncbi:hypothetical protein ES702_04032 [subsurface metagenome]